jgi:hypothetical protein
MRTRLRILNSVKILLSNHRPAALRDPVFGRDSLGQPVGGHILDLDSAQGRILVSPASQHPVWVSAKECVHLDDAFPPEPAPEAEQEQDPATRKGV